MHPTLLFQSVRAIDPSRALDDEVDVVIERGHITRIGRSAGASIVAEHPEPSRVRMFAGRGRWLIPGLVDLHAHLREPGFESKEDLSSGLRAAAAGGYTDVCVMPNTAPVNDNRVVTEFLLLKSRALCNVPRLHPIAAITIGQQGEHLTEMGQLKDAGAVALSDDGRCVTRSDVMRRALEYATTFDLPIIQHAEDHALTAGAEAHEGVVSARLGLRGWPRVAEDIIVARDVLLAEYVGARYHLAHASTQGAARIIREAKARGIKVTAEVTPHHLLLTDRALLGYNTACKVNPPLREEDDVQALREAVADGTIDCIATDHAPHTSLDKDCEFSAALPGMIGLEFCLPLMLGLVRNGVFSRSRMIDAMTRAPARIAGLRPPALAEGEPANLAYVDPDLTWTINPEGLRSKSRNCAFIGNTVQGAVLATICSGYVVFESDALHEANP